MKHTAILVALCLMATSCLQSASEDAAVQHIAEEIKGRGSDNFFIVLKDMGAEGEDLFWHDYEVNIIPNNTAEDIRVTEYNNVKVSGVTFDKHVNDLGMEVLHSKDGNIKTEVGPAGFSMLVGNKQYGEWRKVDGVKPIDSTATTQPSQKPDSSIANRQPQRKDSTRRHYRSGGGSFFLWYFLGRSMFYNNRYGGANRITQQDYRGYQKAQSTGKPYYGKTANGQKRYGTASATSKSIGAGQKWNSLSSQQRQKTRIRANTRAKTARNKGRVKNYKGRSRSFGK